ncbi:MAG: hypothetical protein HZB26_26560 [Candidatus Hydrogenedentes bacterium]|nr:hypothetical protein [Candidatus Hydrogenedentota bacterium]
MVSQAIRTRALRSMFRASPVFALLWEQWRVTRGVMLFAVAVTLGIALPLHFAAAYIRSPLLDPSFVSLGAYFFSLLVVAIFFAVDYSSVDEVRLGIAARQQLLPMRRAWLVLGHFAYRVGMMGALAAALGLVVNALYSREATIPFEDGVTLAVCIMTYVLAISWTVGRNGLSVGFVTALVLVWPMYFSSLYVAHGVFGQGRYTPPLLFMAICSVMAIGGALQCHTTGGRTSAASRFVEREATSHTSKFTSPEQALRWLEWRRRGLVFPVVTILLGASYLSFILIVILLDHYAGLTLRVSLSTPDALLGWIVPGAAIITGMYHLFDDWRRSQSGQDSLVYLKPIPFSEILRNRLRVRITSVLTTFGMLSILCANLFLIAWSAGIPLEKWPIIHEAVSSIATPIAGIILSILVFAGFVSVCWALMGLPPIVVGVIVLWCCLRLAGQSYGPSMDSVFVVYGVGLTVVLALLYYAVAAWRKRTFTRKTVLVWCGLSVPFAMLAVPWAWMIRGSLDLDDVFVTGSALALGLGPALAVFHYASWVKRLRSR